MQIFIAKSFSLPNVKMQWYLHSGQNQDFSWGGEINLAYDKKCYHQWFIYYLLKLLSNYWWSYLLLFSETNPIYPHINPIYQLIIQTFEEKFFFMIKRAVNKLKKIVQNPSTLKIPGTDNKILQNWWEWSLLGSYLSPFYIFKNIILIPSQIL